MFSTASTPGGAYTIKVTGTDADTDPPSNGSQMLNETVAGAVLNVVIIFQENRTPDNLFQGLCITGYGSPSACNTTNPSSSQYDIQTSNWLNNQVAGGVTQPGVIDLGTVGPNPDTYDLSHAHSAFEDMCDLNASGVCQMDGAELIPYACTAGLKNCPPPANPQFMYVNPSDVQAYLTMAQKYAFGDHMFQTNEGPSFPAHQFIISGTSAPSATSTLFAAENPATGDSAGCIALATTTVSVIDSTGSETSNPAIYPCFEHATLTDLLDTAGLTWRYYAPGEGSIWTAPDAISHMCVSSGDGGTCTGPDFTATNPKVVLNQTESNAQILADIQNGALQNVSWVIPTGDDSDHARSNDGCGPTWVTSIVNAIGQSPTYWPNTVIILTWDDWGGWYDHVPPPSVLANCAKWGCGYVYGFRVPLVVISPYITNPGYVSHTNHDFGSILKFIENTYGLGPIYSENGGYADSNALDDLSDLFKFTQPPISFTTIPTPTVPGNCPTDSTPSDPDDD
jgi:phospholipase C